MKKQQLSKDDLINYWLHKAYGITLNEVPTDILKNDFFRTYPVSKELDNEWNEWMIDKLSKHFKRSKKWVLQNYGFIYLDTAPVIIKEDETKS